MCVAVCASVACVFGVCIVRSCLIAWLRVFDSFSVSVHVAGRFVCVCELFVCLCLVVCTCLVVSVCVCVLVGNGGYGVCDCCMCWYVLGLYGFMLVCAPKCGTAVAWGVVCV